MRSTHTEKPGATTKCGEYHSKESWTLKKENMAIHIAVTLLFD